MACTSIGLAGLVIAALSAGCAHETETSGTTTVRSGATSGVRVTGTSERDQTALRLADEICAREVACGAIGDGAKYRTEEACMADQGASAPVQIARWSCTPTQTHAWLREVHRGDPKRAVRHAAPARRPARCVSERRGLR